MIKMIDLIAPWMGKAPYGFSTMDFRRIEPNTEGALVGGHLWNRPGPKSMEIATGNCQMIKTVACWKLSRFTLLNLQYLKQIWCHVPKICMNSNAFSAKTQTHVFFLALSYGFPATSMVFTHLPRPNRPRMRCRLRRWSRSHRSAARGVRESPGAPHPPSGRTAKEGPVERAFCCC